MDAGSGVQGTEWPYFLSNPYSKRQSVIAPLTGRIDAPCERDTGRFHVSRFPGGDDRPDVTEDRDLFPPASELTAYTVWVEPSTATPLTLTSHEK